MRQVFLMMSFFFHFFVWIPFIFGWFISFTATTWCINLRQPLTSLLVCFLFLSPDVQSAYHTTAESNHSQSLLLNLFPAGSLPSANPSSKGTWWIDTQHWAADTQSAPLSWEKIMADYPEKTESALTRTRGHSLEALLRDIKVLSFL